MTWKEKNIIDLYVVREENKVHNNLFKYKFRINIF